MRQLVKSSCAGESHTTSTIVGATRRSILQPWLTLQGNAIRVLNVQGAQIGHLPRVLAAKLAKYMDNRSLHIEAHITGPMGAYDCPLELKLYGTNEPVERENLFSQMRADKLPIGHAADRKRKEAAAEKERQRLAKEAAKNAKKKGGVVVETNTYDGENGMAEFMAGSSQGFGPGPSLEDIIGSSERFNPRNVDQVVEEFGVKESDLVCDKSSCATCAATNNRRRICQRRRSQKHFLHSCTLSSCKAYNGCSTVNPLNYLRKARRILSNFGNAIHG